MAITIHPLAKVNLLSVAASRPANYPRLVIFHTNAGGGSSDGNATRRWIESELAAGRTPTQPHHQVDLDGTIWQFLPYDRKGVASAAAEGFCISCETQDYGTNHSSIETQPWTEEQVEALALIALFANRQYAVPLRRPTGPYESGIGTHSMWGYNTSSNMKINPWTTVIGKTCPGAARKAQLDRIIARAVTLAGDVQPPPPPPKDNDMLALIQDSTGVYVTDWKTRRAVAPEDIQLFAYLGLVPMNGPNAQVVPVSNAAAGRIRDVSPGLPQTIIPAFPSVASATAIAAAVIALLPKGDGNAPTVQEIVKGIVAETHKRTEV